jgi:hypothetical protein
MSNIGDMFVMVVELEQETIRLREALRQIKRYACSIDINFFSLEAIAPSLISLSDIKFILFIF